MLRYIWMLLAFFEISSTQQFNAAQYPFPLHLEQYKQCHMKAPANLCDRDEVLSQSDRYRLDYALKRISSATKSDQGSQFCDTKGVQAILAIAREGPPGAARELRDLWKLDDQCKKAVVFFLSANDHKLYYSGAENTGISESDFDAIVRNHQGELGANNITQAVLNILREITTKVTQHHGTGGGTMRGDRVGQPLPAKVSAITPSLQILVISLLFCFKLH